VPYFSAPGRVPDIFSVLYAVGGMVVAVSGIAAFIHVAANQKGPRRLFALSLVNTIIPTRAACSPMLQFR